MSSLSESSKADLNRTDVEMLAKAFMPDRSSTVVRGGDEGSPKQGGPEAVDAAFNEIASRLLPELQLHLNSLVGLDFGPTANAKLSKSVTRLLRRLGCTLECPHCLAPALLRYSFIKGPHGYFRYEHNPSKRHGGTRALGPLKLLRVAPDPENLNRIF